MAKYDVIDATVTGYLEFTVRFADGLSGTVTIAPSKLYGVFERLSDPEMFNQIQTKDGFVSWPCNVDLAPDAMYDAIRRDGIWVLS